MDEEEVKTAKAKPTFRLKANLTGTVIAKSRTIHLARATSEDLEFLYNLSLRWAARIEAPAGYSPPVVSGAKKK